jgi:hypothetical protein
MQKKKKMKKLKDKGLTYAWIHSILSKKIRKDFGKSTCKDFNISCSTCQAYLALQIIEDMIDLECWDYLKDDEPQFHSVWTGTGSSLCACTNLKCAEAGKHTKDCICYKQPYPKW